MRQLKNVTLLSMKNTLKFCAIVLSIVLLQACSQDFKVSAPYKNVTTVFGLLAMSDTAHYIKIGKGFFDEKNNNLSFAKNADSLYYDTLYVVINEKDAGNNVVSTTVLQKVNLTNEGYIKDSGIFINNPAYAYKFKKALNDNYTYELKITNPKTGAVITGSTPIISNSGANNKFYVEDILLFDFSNKLQATKFRWRTPENSSLIEIYLRFNYYEKDGNGIQGDDKFVDLPIAQDLDGVAGTLGLYDFANTSFLSLINANVGAAPTGTTRYVDTPAVIYYAGGTELKKYIDLSKAQGGITADEIQPVYTNLLGDNVYGILNTRVKRTVNGVPLAISTTNMMFADPAWSQLKFVGLSNH
jgi:hypothetical protein